MRVNWIWFKHHWLQSYEYRPTRAKTLLDMTLLKYDTTLEKRNVTKMPLILMIGKEKTYTKKNEALKSHFVKLRIIRHGSEALSY